MVGVGTSVTLLCALQLAVVPPFDPAQDQVQGPDPPTALAVPVEQRLVVGAVETVVLLDEPQVPLIKIKAGVDAATVTFTTADTVPAPELSNALAVRA